MYRDRGAPLVRVDTDEGISGFAQIESPKTYIKPHVLFYKRLILGQDPTNVERLMLRIRRLGGFKPWKIPCLLNYFNYRRPIRI